ncbi:MAG: penicillin-insensitive murein endopeptidase [Bdellovibrio sp. CG12_big_fil_rev_8_21_14_0_65_39_13]|nr:MAG: penicillin-insensitive murein endopeptidase [Bdellovibrio sp. CG22_combo_CG10-13_8_21_14_all_39_27]PIQ57544.1 MAG: penicillin-insensitive murein endopeptidase [Bdellovibrio sp. CG12_big_fil_rev_8_21_14_0_65_39_13]PIR33747.1 MAG: penicillin-insensitive murein endopeptidase [Bdellovibrio sp. CG11_big_fil_rev_8_21_14_0_20_39_38]PJB52709.1 MAG: penicillin-insensitive murein endopeptidase [Bdellovibrio sp. CG_4_9_14_3_um_filter_39_7]
MIRLFLFLSLILFVGCTHHLPDFTSRMSTRLPTESTPQAIGEYALGCLQGAQTFTGQEKGIILSQVKRGRYWGHPDLIQLLTQAGEETYKKRMSLIVGDLSQSRGGPTITGHNSHQTGLDVDVWFKMPSIKEKLSLRTIETEDMKPIASLSADQIKMIQFFTRDPRVERIFINPGFKKYLCSDSAVYKLSSEDHHKLRAWYGHDDHIHVRLKCPSDSPLCISQKPIPEGDGCDKNLDWWFTEEAKEGEADISWEELKKIYLSKVEKLPTQCSFYHEIF